MSTALVPKMNLPVVADSLDAYIQQVNAIPLLSDEQEQELARRLQLQNDLEAARQLILPHLRFVVRIARGYLGYGLALGDLIQEGNIGLMKAVKRFDPTYGVRLVTFAVHWIRAEIQEFILRNWRIVKVATTKAQRKLFFNLRSGKKRLGWMSQDEVDAMADDLDVGADTVLEMESRMSGQDIAYDPYSGANDSDGDMVLTPAEYLADRTSDPLVQLEGSDWEDQARSQFADALENLDDRSRAILQRRWLDDEKTTLQELAAEYGVSAERIRQIETAAIKKLRACVTV